MTRLHDGRRMVIAAADAAAQALGLHAGMALAHAQAMVPELGVADADLAGDAAFLGRLAEWCLRLSPLVAVDSDGLWIDATGCTHAYGGRSEDQGETAMLAVLVARLTENGIAARSAIAPTPGAAHAVARFGRGGPVPGGPAPGGPVPGGPVPGCTVPATGIEAALAPLPLASLRLDADTVAGLQRLGFDTVGQLATTPRAPLARRFGAAVLHRLDQATGRAPEPIMPLVPASVPHARACFVEPLLTAEAFATVIARLTRQVAGILERGGLGARQADLVFERVDGTTQVIRIGMGRPARDPAHLARMLGERIEQVDPGLGVEAMQLVVPLAEPFSHTQATHLDDDAAEGLATLVDRLANRLGAEKLWRVEAVESDVPERSVRRIPALSPPTGRNWPGWPRPARLLSPPQPIDAVALMPDYPPAAFTWRRHRHRVRRADGPERITGEWWQRDAEMTASRDYWQVEDETGRRFWLYRRGDGVDPATGDLRWFLHGVF